MIKSFAKYAFIVLCVAAALRAVAFAGTLCDQGMPGRQGPWGVYILTPTQLVSQSNVTTNLTPGAIAGHAVYSHVITQSGSVAGQTCGVAVPAGFDTATFVASCVAASGSVTLYIYNTTAGSASPTAGNYITVTF